MTSTGAGSPRNRPVNSVQRRSLIDDRLVETQRTFPTLNSATGAVIGHAPDAGVAEADAVICAAQNLRHGGRMTTLHRHGAHDLASRHRGR